MPWAPRQVVITDGPRLLILGDEENHPVNKTFNLPDQADKYRGLEAEEVEARRALSETLETATNRYREVIKEAEKVLETAAELAHADFAQDQLQIAERRKVLDAETFKVVLQQEEERKIQEAAKLETEPQPE